ncbi:helix-turn-helix domain-containing protein, partial [Knoellia sinensis]|uniref:helix-turn-helix domain-containing protein n=1 Tax=Knoellia sinensis TaxID=136100 RepID=UPI0005694DC8
PIPTTPRGSVDAGIGLTTWSLSGESVKVDVDLAGGHVPTPDQLAAAAEVAPQHPAMTSLGLDHALRVSDVVPIRQFWGTDAYEGMHGYFDGRYPIAIPLRQTPTSVMFLGGHRADRDFTDGEVTAFEALQRVLVAGLSFRAALDSLTDVLQAQKSSNRPASLPESSKWTVPVPESSKQTVSGTRELAPAVTPAVALCADYEPTRREAEVLALAATGWTNVRIARRLGIAERTVRKHLSSVYEHTGQRGRAAAAAWWTRRCALD